MNFEGKKLQHNLGKEYTEHKVFGELKLYSDFYGSLSFSIMNQMSLGTNSIVNIDTYTLSSIKGTIDSITEILNKGRINDAYSLLRKYFDSIIINIYSNLYLQDHFSINDFIVSKIDNWINGSESIPEYRVISKYIKDSPKIKSIVDLLGKDDRYKRIRERCNDNTHYNFYYNVLLNDNEIFNPKKIKHLDQMSFDVESLFIQHFAYIFYLNDSYFIASDYIDSLDLGMIPEEDSQRWVSPFIQKVFDNIIKIKRPDIAEEIKNN
jgi:hypothetical protein